LGGAFDNQENMKNNRIVIIAIIVLGICGCGAGLALGSYFLIGSSLGIADCGWDGTALAWIDENRDGAWDGNEKPLSGVEFIVDDIRHDYDSSHEAISDANGKVSVAVFPVACNGFNEIEIVISAIPPENYELTTSSQITVPQEAVQNSENDQFLFGFIEKAP
jgi:hypothetical protein